MSEYVIRPICPQDDPQIARIVRANLEAYHLDIPGTAYFDPELESLSRYYGAKPDLRAYFVAADTAGNVVGGVGIAEFSGLAQCAELQKLYLCDEAKGHGLGKRLMQTARDYARKIGYKALYLETHTNLLTAIALYEKLGFEQIEKPAFVQHGTMNRFYLKRLQQG